jgi:hypothetical protein
MRTLTDEGSNREPHAMKICYYVANKSSRRLRGQPRDNGNDIANRHLRFLCLKAGIKKHVTFHVARHTFATLSLNKGIPIEIVSSLLGHNNIQTTQVYTRIMDSTKKKMMERWNQGLKCDLQTGGWFIVGSVGSLLVQCWLMLMHLGAHSDFPDHLAPFF